MKRLKTTGSKSFFASLKKVKKNPKCLDFVPVPAEPISTDLNTAKVFSRKTNVFATETEIIRLLTS